MKTLTTLAALAFSLSLLACSGGGDAPNAATETGSAPLTIAEQCVGRVSCSVEGGDAVSSTFHLEADGCHLGGLRLSPDGYVDGSDGTAATWSSTASSLSVCAEGACFTCTRAAGATASASAATTTTTTTTTAPKTCVGTAYRCGSFTETWCKGQAGCWVNNQSELPTDACEGTATPCNSYESAESCDMQMGCSWE